MSGSTPLKEKQDDGTYLYYNQGRLGLVNLDTHGIDIRNYGSHISDVYTIENGITFATVLADHDNLSAPPPNFYVFDQGQLITKFTHPDERFNPDRIIYQPSNELIYLMSGGGSTLEILRYENEEVSYVGSVSIGHGNSFRKVAVDPASEDIYVANFADNTVSIINGTNNIATIDVGWYPFGLAVDSATGHLYVSNTNELTVSIFKVRPD